VIAPKLLLESRLGWAGSAYTDNYDEKNIRGAKTTKQALLDRNESQRTLKDTEYQLSEVREALEDTKTKNQELKREIEAQKVELLNRSQYNAESPPNYSGTATFLS